MHSVPPYHHHHHPILTVCSSPWPLLQLVQSSECERRGPIASLCRLQDSAIDNNYFKIKLGNGNETKVHLLYSNALLRRQIRNLFRVR